MLEINISIDGELVKINSLFLSYTPVSKKSTNTLLSFEATMSLFTGKPISLAMYAASTLPKFPVGTQILIFSPSSISEFDNKLI